MDRSRPERWQARPGISRVEEFRPSARVIADSVSEAGDRLSTVEVRLHRFVLAELNTHRAFSRNSASSRAIPVHRQMATVASTPALPLWWPAERKGMQGGGHLPADATAQARDVWLSARDAAVVHAEKLVAIGLHKSVVNRLLEPFLPHTVVLSATHHPGAWDNFFDQRCSPLAQAELAVAAEAVRTALRDSEPRPVPWRRYHLPYIQRDEFARIVNGVTMGLSWDVLPRISAARCARVSYLTHTGVRDTRADLDLFNRLIEADPPHASPLEHVATPCGPGLQQLGNFRGWRQYRHIILGPYTGPHTGSHNGA